MAKTNIPWTDWSLNFIKWFCTKTSPGCKNCYMFAMAKRYKSNAADHPVWRPNSVKDLRKIPSGAFVFVGDMYDQYHEQMPVEWIHNVHNMAAYQRPDLQFQMLTKRIERVAQLAPHLIWPDNLWMGTTVENADYSWRIDYLREIPAKMKFISFEPLLDDVGNVDLTGIDCAIVGAESGAGRRPFDKQWARNIRTQCRKHDTAFFYKQSSGMTPGTDPILDGRSYHEFPHGMTPLKGKPEPAYKAKDRLARDGQAIEILSPIAGRHGNLLRIAKLKDYEDKRIYDGSSFTVAPEELSSWITGKLSGIAEPVPAIPPKAELNKIVCGHVLDYLVTIKSNTVHTIITSPPYWGLRDYGTDPIDWPAISYSPMPGIPDIEIPAMTASLGQEPDLNSFIGHLVLIFREARRVLHETGTLWVNMGDSYCPNGKWGGSSSGKNDYSIDGGYKRSRREIDCLKPKDMVMQPARLALALQADGYYLRSDIIWQKPNSMPESVNDRPTTNHEYVFLLAKSPRYYYDKHAITEPVKQSSVERANRAVSTHHKNLDNSATPPGNSTHSMHKSRANGDGYDMPATKNKRTVWTVSTKGFPGAHFATFPEKLIEPMILAGCSPKVCPTCLSPWNRITEKDFIPQDDVSPERGIKGAPGQKPQYEDNQWGDVPRGTTRTITTGWQPTCKCSPKPSIPGTVLDMFIGSGTTAIVAAENSRNYMGCDLNPEYVEMANKRLSEPIQQDMFTSAGILTNSSGT